MVNAIDLVFVEDRFEFLIELFSRLQIGAERLLDDNAGEACTVLFAAIFDQANLAELFDDG